MNIDLYYYSIYTCVRTQTYIYISDLEKILFLLIYGQISISISINLFLYKEDTYISCCEIICIRITL